MRPTMYVWICTKNDVIDVIIAVDFDGTLVDDKFPEIGDPKDKVINWCINKQNEGHYIGLYTLRQGQLLNDALKFCDSKGLKFNIIFFGKPHADIYLDDKNKTIPEIEGEIEV